MRALRSETSDSRAPVAESKFERAVALTERHFPTKSRFLFSPIYVRNHCVNDCAYCGYRRGNRTLPRTKLTPEEAAFEAAELVRRGVHRVLVLAGELPEAQYLDHFCRCVESIRSVSGIDWIGIEIAPLSVGGCRRLRTAGSDAFIVFQESYDRSVYAGVHPVGDPKARFDDRIESVFVAATAGFREIGLGVLYGLADPAEETARMIEHAESIERQHSGTELRISFPRFRPSAGARMHTPPRPVDESELREAIVRTRLRLPTARLVLTARESLEFRLGVSPIVTDFGAGGSTTVGGYVTRRASSSSEQFILLDTSSVDCFRSAAERLGIRLR